MPTPFTLARRAVVVTFDLSARNLHLLRSDHWLSDPKNIAPVWLTQPVFGTASPAPTNPREQMMGWSVRNVVAFFESKDAAALGEKLAGSSVQGADLLRMSVALLQAKLGFNAFAAQKICRLRDAFLD